jgi:hypothetical protein
MVVLGETTKEVRQKDGLFSRMAILTLGLEIIRSGGSERSVSWSLPLANLQYYGNPVRTSRSLGEDSNRVTMDDFAFVVLGCIFSRWKFFSRDIETGCRWLRYIADIVRSQIPHMFTGTLYHPPSALWTNILLAAIDRLEDYDEVEKRLARQLIALSRRRPMFIYSNTDANPLFGLSRLSTLLPLMKSVNSRIQLLRNLAHQWCLSNEHYIIRYRPDGGFDNLDTVFEYAAVSPVVIDQGKRANDGSSKISPIYRRWISVGQHELQDFDLSLIRLHSRFACQVPHCKGSTNVFCRNAEHSLIWQRAQMFLRLGEQCFPALDYQPGGTLGTSLYFINELDFMMAIDSARDTFWKSCFINPGGLITNLTYSAGDPNTAAIFSMKVESSPKVNSFGEIGPHMLEPHQMEGILTPEIINTEALVGKLYNLTAINSEYESLKALASVSEVYKLLPDAMVSTAVVGIPIYGTRWFPRLRDAVTSQSGGALQPVLRLSRAEVFACISIFDSGSYNLDPDALQEVFAMSSGNSIYVTGSMICDPYEQSSPTEVRRVVGNIG